MVTYICLIQFYPVGALFVELTNERESGRFDSVESKLLVCQTVRQVQPIDTVFTKNKKKMQFEFIIY